MFRRRIPIAALVGHNGKWENGGAGGTRTRVLHYFTYAFYILSRSSCLVIDNLIRVHRLCPDLGLKAKQQIRRYALSHDSAWAPILHQL